jgi:hypothetical protein
VEDGQKRRQTKSAFHILKTTEDLTIMNKHMTFAEGLVQANRWSSRPGFSTSWF